MNFGEFRREVLDEQDEVWEEYDGETPDHLIVSQEIYSELEGWNRLEPLSDKSHPRRPGYLGMKVWYSRALDERGKKALLISDEVFEQIVTRAEDYKNGSTERLLTK